jgi:hypothetical protein
MASRSIYDRRTRVASSLPHLAPGIRGHPVPLNLFARRAGLLSMLQVFGHGNLIGSLERPDVFHVLPHGNAFQSPV